MSQFQSICIDFFGVFTDDEAVVAEKKSDESGREKLEQATEQSDIGQLPWDSYLKIYNQVTGLQETTEERVTQKLTTLNWPLVNLLREKVSQGYAVYLFSNCDKEYIDEVITKCEIEDIFSGYAISSQLKAVKPSRAYYQKSIVLLELEPSTCLFIDDRQENCRAAEDFGFTALQYREWAQFKSEFAHILGGSDARTSRS